MPQLPSARASVGTSARRQHRRGERTVPAGLTWFVICPVIFERVFPGGAAHCPGDVRRTETTAKQGIGALATPTTLVRDQVLAESFFSPAFLIRERSVRVRSSRASYSS